MIRVGPAGWSYDDWREIVYVRGIRIKPLEWISALFDAVEVNVTFYRLVSESMVVSWCEQVEANPNFMFTVKAWQKFTHENADTLEPVEVSQFCKALQAFVKCGRLGAVLLQFPWGFRRERKNRLRLARLVELFSGYPLAVEFRHDSWNVSAVHREFTSRNIAFCNIDQPLFEGSLPPTEIVTSNLAYIRLHGRNAKNWFRDGAGRDQRYDYLYSEEEIQFWVEKAKRIAQRAENLFIITNNHYRGQAVVNALEIQHALKIKRVQVSQTLIEHYPRLERLLR